jgi:hypothetical protein
VRWISHQLRQSQERSGERLLKTTMNVGLGQTVILGKSRPAEEADALVTVVTVDGPRHSHAAR